MSGADRFFAYARERYSVYLKRQRGEPWPWTDDPVLRKYKFTNVFREDDATTVWFRENVREVIRSKPECLLATVLFRWFNRVSSGEVIFCQPDLHGMTPWDYYLRDGDVTMMRHALKTAFPRGPYVTGAYMIRSPNDMSKLDGMLHLCREFWKSEWRRMADIMLTKDDPDRMTSEWFTRWLQQHPGQGPFLAYEVTCDLQHTNLLCDAPDNMTWANLGPGARRGLNRIHERQRSDYGHRIKRKWKVPITEERALAEMRDLLAMSRDNDNWPSEWPAWDMRTVEHTLCEFDKYERALNSEGVPKQLYRRSMR